MTIIDQARSVYKTEPCAYTFEQDLNWHLDHGFVFSRPDFFVMGRPVVSTAPEDAIVGHHHFASRFCDCWHVHLMAGNMARAWDMLPWTLPLVSYQRQNVLRFYPLASIRRLCQHFNQ